jgi:hypothetical protein
LKVIAERNLDFNPNGLDKVESWQVSFDPQNMQIHVGWKTDKKEDEDNMAKRSKRNKKPNRLLFDDYLDKYDYLDHEEPSEKKNKRKNMFNNELPK